MQLVPPEGEIPQERIQNAERQTLEVVGGLFASYAISQFFRMLALKGTGLRNYLPQLLHVNR